MGGRLPILTGKAPFDLGLDVERLEPARDPARVAGFDERAHLGAQLVVGRALERVELERRAAVRGPAGVGRLQQLPDLLVAERVVWPAPRGRR